MTYLYLILFPLILVSCNEDPYPEVGDITEVKPLEGIRQVAYVIDPSVREMSFPEGIRNEYKIDVYVPAGEPLITFRGLPENQGASFDQTTHMLSWEPSYDAANGEDPLDRAKYYPVTVELSSTAEPQTIIFEDIVLKVTDTPRDMVINSPNDKNQKVQEGHTLEFELSIDSDDFPQGPFSMQGLHMPSGMTLKEKPGSPTSFIVEYQPHHSTVNLNNSQGLNCINYGAKNCSQKFNQVQFIATGPDGRSATLDNMSIEVVDTRIPVLFGIAPEIEIESPGGIFTIASMDQNHEVRPNIKIISPPSFGDIETVTVENERARYTTVLQVHWNNIPPAKTGSVATFRFQSCIKNSTEVALNRCNNKLLYVHVAGTPNRRPTIVRQNWEKGEVKRIAYGQRENFIIQFKDATDGRTIKGVNIFPESLRNMVSFNANFTRLSITGSQPGLHHLQLETEGKFGVGAIENFTFEVFPESRANTIYVGDSPRDRSLGHFQAISDINYFSPILHTDIEREFLHRDQMVISTESLAANLVDDALLEYENFHTIFIASPSLGELPEGFRARIGELGIFFDGNLSDRSPGDALPPDLAMDAVANVQDVTAEWELIVVNNDSGMEQPKGRIELLPG